MRISNCTVQRFLAVARSVPGAVVAHSGGTVDGFVGSAEYTSNLTRVARRMALEKVFEEIRTRLEERITHQLSGLQGFVVRPMYNSVMPLHVEMSLAPKTFEFVFLKDGAVELTHGSKADVRIESDPQTFMSLFQNPSAELFKELERQNKIKITSLTKKGNDAEGYIRRYLAG